MNAGKIPFFRNLFDTGTRAIIIPQSVIVPDISFWQDNNETTRKVDFVKMKSNGAKGVIIRAGQNTWPDPDFADYWREAKAAGLPRGTYWFYDSRVSANVQADLFWNQFKNDMPEMEVVSDYEENYGGSYGGWQNLYNFISRLISNGVPVSKNAIYTGYYYWLDHSPQNNVTSLNWFKQFKLWIAWYTSNPANVSIPRPWTNDDLLAWQFTSSGDGAAYGVESNAIDLNWWNATPEQFAARYGGVVIPPPSDVVTHPFPGVTVTRGRRFGTDVQVLEMNRDSIASSRAVWGGVGARVQDIAGDIVVNGGDFDQITFRAVGLLVSDGTVFSPQANFEPAFGMWPNGEAEISHMRTSWPNAIGLKRYLVENGQISQNYSDSWNDRAPRTIYCVKADGSPFVFCARGYQDGQAGLSLFDCAAVALEFGAQWAGDGDGGYSTQMKIGNEIFGATTNRYDEVADFWSFTIKGASMWKRVNTAVLNIRRGPAASYTDIGDLLRDDVVEIVDTAAGGWGRIGSWYRAGTLRTLPDATNSWCQTGYLVDTTSPIVTPPPTPPAGTFTVELTDDSTGEVWKGTLTKQ